MNGGASCPVCSRAHVLTASSFPLFLLALSVRPPDDPRYPEGRSQPLAGGPDGAIAPRRRGVQKTGVIPYHTIHLGFSSVLLRLLLLLLLCCGCGCGSCFLRRVVHGSDGWVVGEAGQPTGTSSTERQEPAFSHLSLWRVLLLLLLLLLVSPMPLPLFHMVHHR